MRKLILAATSIAALAVPAIVPMMASATSPANQTFSVGTHSPQHLDTTSASGDATIASAGGPVWAYDNLNLKYVVTPGLGADQWNVAVTSQGSFAGFASPTTGNADINNGSTKGSITYTVTSSHAPNMVNVPSQEPNSSSIRLPIIQMFNLPADTTAIGGGNVYNFTYNTVDGAVYTQSASSSS